MTGHEATAEPGSVNAESSRLGTVRRGINRRVTDPAWVGRAVSVGLCVVSIGFVVGFVLVLGSSGQLALVTRPLPVQVVFALPYLVTLLAAGTVVSAVAAWRRGYWSFLGRVHQTVLAVLGLVFVWQLVALGFVP